MCHIYKEVTSESVSQFLYNTPVQIPIGLEDSLEGLVCLIEMKAHYPIGKTGEVIKIKDIPQNLLAQSKEKRAELIATLGKIQKKIYKNFLADVDEEIEELFLMEEEPTVEQLNSAIRRQTLARNFCPVFMGSAYKNKGVQLALDGVTKFLPSPHEKENFGFIRGIDY